MTIDLGRPGKSGIEARIANGVLYIVGSDHYRDWLHHFLPGARRREMEAARQICAVIEQSRVMVHTVAGHSLGGCIATIVASMLGNVRLYVYGGKRAPRAYYREPDAAYRHRGDIVPFLPPWRPRWRESITIGQWDVPWRAHEPRRYYRQMGIDGVR